MTPGTKLGPYEILDAIGAGGMGEVYKARDTRLDRIVAIKTSKEQFSERFEREARAVAALNHPNICTLHDVGPNYLVMEYIEGPTLAERIHAGAIPLAEALPIARQIAEALEAAHEKGIVHRDLKPANIKFTLEGKVKVLDFGLAKAFDTESAAADSRNSPTLTLSATRAGMILGTAGYMSPEQARGTPADKRADIWSYGVVLFEMLTGRHTFAGETVSDTLAAVLRADLNWSALPPDTPPPIRRLLRRCLERDRKKRLHDIADAALELDEAPEPASAPARGNPRWPIAALGLAVLIALALGAVHFRETPPLQPATVRMQIALPPKTIFGGHVSISPDGRRVAFSAGGAQQQPQMWVQALDALEARPLPGTDGAGFFFWSPDSRFIGFWADGKVKKVQASGGPPQTICDKPLALGGTWNRDGVILLGGTPGTGISRVSAAGGTPVPLTKLDTERQESYHAWPVFLPDGKHFLYMAGRGEAEANDIYVATLDARLGYRDPKRLTVTRSGAAYAPEPDPAKGHLLFLRESTLMAQAFDAGRLELTGEAFPAAERVGIYLTRGYYAAASNGTILYRTGGASGFQLEWFDRQGKSLGTVGPPGTYVDMALARDNKRAAVSRGDQSTSLDLWLVDLLRNISTRFTSQPASETNPVWSPDGSRIAYGARDIFQKISSGAGKEELLLQSVHFDYPFDWSSDGKFLLYGAQDPNTKFDLWVLPLEGDRKPRSYLRTEFNESLGQFSPDGRWVAYTSDENGRPEVYVQQSPAAGGKWTISSSGGVQPRWRGDGKELFYLTLDGRVMAVELKTGPGFEPGVPQELFRARMVLGLTDFRNFRYAAAADGKRFLIIGAPQESDEAPITVVLNWKGSR